MSDSNVIPIKQLDFIQRFLFEDLDIRGELVRFETEFNRILAVHDYPVTVAQQLGELLLASILLSSSIKYEGRLSLQVQGKGPVTLMMAECSSKQQVRAIAKYNQDLFSEGIPLSFADCFANATLSIYIEPDWGERYQGIVPLEGENLAQCLAFYFEQSEQLATEFFLVVDILPHGNSRGAGMMFQQLPVSQQQKVVDVTLRQEQWNYVMQLSNTLTCEELFDLPVEDLLHRLFHEDDIRLFDSKAVHFYCRCSRERYVDVLSNLDKAELQSILSELGVITVTCEFCHQHYEFSAEDVGL